MVNVSNFKLAAWIPRYLRWYFFAFGPRLSEQQVRVRVNHISDA